jgi:hypothetical protein
MDYSNIFPTRYVPASKATKYEQLVIVNWLKQEIDNTAAERMPVLKKLKGHRNREVFFFIKDGPDWTKRIYL